MAYNLTPEELLQLAEQVNASGEEPYDMGQRHQYEIMVAELKGAQNQAADEQNQAAYDNQMQTWENQGVPPENLVRAKPTPPAQGASVPASPTQGDLINPANPMKLV